VVEPVEGFFGGIAADEPRAAIAGRDVLTSGGTAADAAVAMAFSLAVTLPSSAGLGGGGSCVAYDAPKLSATAFDFSAAPAAESRVSVPALPRGLAVMHARLGKLTWAQLLGPAEAAARFGAPVSRALARDLASAPSDLTEDPATARIFAPQGRLIQEGETLVQLDLASVLGQLRQRGVGELYSGALSRVVTASSGGELTQYDLRSYLPQTRPPASVRYGDLQLFLAGEPATSTALLGRLLGIMIEADASAGDRARIFAEAGAVAEDDLAQALQRGRAELAPTRDEARALAARARSAAHVRPARALGPVEAGRAGATSFIAVDRNGLAVACALGMNAPWGTGKVLPGTGMLVAAIPSDESPRAAGLLAVAPANGAFRLAASASGRAAPAALTQVALGILAERQEVQAAVNRPRAAYDGAADLLHLEAGAIVPPGLRTAETAPLGVVNALGCPEDMNRNRGACRLAVDPRGAGLGFGGGR
jgi:gamma-glutamyltranspeptidase/glutathione hydrolase